MRKPINMKNPVMNPVTRRAPTIPPHAFLLLTLLVLAAAAALSMPALAVDTDALEDALPDEARDVLGDVTVTDAAGDGVFSRLWERAKDEAAAGLSDAARSACVALAVTLLASAAGAVSEDGKTPGYALLGASLAITGASMGDIRSFLSQTRAALLSLSDFSRALLPCVAAASAAAGSGAAGAARYTVSAVFLDLLMSVGTDVILPVICACAALAAAHAALPDGALGGVVKLISWACTTLLTTLTTVFTLCLTLSGVIAGSSGKLAGSLAKTAISASLPVVGRILSDAAETYLAGAKLLRGAVGIFGLAAVLAVCLGPMVKLGLHYLLFRAAACVAEPFADARLSGLMGHIASCYGMALGLLGSAGAMLFVSAVLGAGVLSG